MEPWLAAAGNASRCPPGSCHWFSVRRARPRHHQHVARDELQHVQRHAAEFALSDRVRVVGAHHHAWGLPHAGAHQQGTCRHVAGDFGAHRVRRPGGQTLRQQEEFPLGMLMDRCMQGLHLRTVQAACLEAAVQRRSHGIQQMVVGLRKHRQCGNGRAYRAFAQSTADSTCWWRVVSFVRTTTRAHAGARSSFSGVPPRPAVTGSNREATTTSDGRRDLMCSAITRCAVPTATALPTCTPMRCARTWAESTRRCRSLVVCAATVGSSDGEGDPSLATMTLRRNDIAVVSPAWLMTPLACPESGRRWLRAQAGCRSAVRACRPHHEPPGRAWRRRRSR